MDYGAYPGPATIARIILKNRQNDQCSVLILTSWDSSLKMKLNVLKYELQWGERLAVQKRLARRKI